MSEQMKRSRGRLKGPSEAVQALFLKVIDAQLVNGWQFAHAARKVTGKPDGDKRLHTYRQRYRATYDALWQVAVDQYAADTARLLFQNLRFKVQTIIREHSHLFAGYGEQAMAIEQIESALGHHLEQCVEDMMTQGADEETIDQFITDIWRVAVEKALSK